MASTPGGPDPVPAPLAAEPADPPNFDVQVDEIARRATNGGLSAERFSDDRGMGIRLRFGEQRTPGAVRVVRDEYLATEILSVPFEFARLVPDYLAVFDARDGSVEARATSALPFTPSRLDALPEGYVLTAADGEASITYGPSQDVTRLLTRLRRLPRERRLRNPAVFRFTGFGVASSEGARRLLDTIGAYVLLSWTSRVT
jgi:hypothetical protein